jgi:hypothetical protein
MAYMLTPSVQQEIERAFAPEHVGYVRSRLAERELPMARSAPPPRVHIAVIWLSKGDIKRFDYELEGACCDWRDTLISADLADENWKHVLTRKGIDCEDW